MTAYDHLVRLNADLIAALDAVELPDAEALDALLAQRAVLLDAVQRSRDPLPAPVRDALAAQHHRLAGLLDARLADVRQTMQRLDLLDRARSEYATPAPRSVLRSGLDA